MKDLRLLIGGSSSFFFHLQEFSNTLNNLGIESKLVFDADYSDGFPGRKIGKWFQTGKKFTKLIDEYKPDAIFIDRQRHFGINSLKAGIPLFVLLRGHYWSEMDWNKRTMYRSFPKRIALSQWDKIGKEIFAGATAILPICKYLEKITKKFVPGKPTNVFSEGVDASKWYNVEGLELKHPCVGLLQYANWWGKTSEMLVLKKVLERMPDVHFYWVGDGPLRERVLSELNGYNNFHWLGKLQYPDKVREYLVGGNQEMMIDGRTGFLVEQGNHEQLVDKLSLLLEDKELAKKMGEQGRKFIEETFNWELVTKKFIKIAESYLK